MNEEELRKWQMEELSILKRFARYCDDFELRYFLLGGTLLGAVRHQGFIPWDDNVDVAMPREDYNAFVEKMKHTELPEPFRFLTFENTRGYRYPWARMISVNMKVILKNTKIPRIEHAWIDILPLDGVPDHPGEAYLHRMELNALWRFNRLVQYDETVDQEHERTVMEGIKNKTADLVHRFVKSRDYKKTLRSLTRELEEYPYRIPTEKVMNYLKSDGFREVFPRKCFENVEYYPFEDTFLAGPKDYDTVLRIIYGEDYMKIPPESEQTILKGELVTETWRK